MNKEKIKQKMKELDAFGKGLNTFGKELEVFGKELEVWLEEPEDKADSEFKLKLNAGNYHYLGDDTFNCFPTEGQTKIASDRKSAQDELLQMAFILNGDWKPDWKDSSENKYCIHFKHDKSEFRSDYNNCYSYGMVYFKIEPIKYFLATASDNLKAYIKGELQ